MQPKQKSANRTARRVLMSEVRARFERLLKRASYTPTVPGLARMGAVRNASQHDPQLVLTCIDALNNNTGRTSPAEQFIVDVLRAYQQHELNPEQAELAIARFRSRVASQPFWLQADAVSLRAREPLEL